MNHRMPEPEEWQKLIKACLSDSVKDWDLVVEIIKSCEIKPMDTIEASNYCIANDCNCNTAINGKYYEMQVLDADHTTIIRVDGISIISINLMNAKWYPKDTK